MKKLGEAENSQEHELEATIRRMPMCANGVTTYALAVSPIASPMHCGVDNHCWLVESEERNRYFVKLLTEEGSQFVDFSATVAAAKIAGDAGVAAPVVWFDSNCRAVAWEHLGENWRAAMLADLERPATFRRAISALKAVHAISPFGRTRTVFDLIDNYVSKARELGVQLPTDFAWMLANVLLMRPQIEKNHIMTVPCHGDNIASNFMIERDGSVLLVDWDESGDADPYWDLGSLFAEVFPFDAPARLAFQHYLGDFNENLFARTRLYGIADDFSWAVRSMISAASSTRVDLEYFKYAQWRFLRCRMHMHDPRFAERLNSA